MTQSALKLPKRQTKPRKSGLTAITDLGMPVKALRDTLESYHAYLDIAKFGVGSAFMEPLLANKLSIYREFGIVPYFGGTLFEKFFSQDAIPNYAKFLRKYGVEWIEISNGTVDCPLKKRVQLVKQMSKEFSVVAEVGCKDSQKIMPPSLWIEELQSLLDAGARYVITEGRDSATAGIYRPSGEVREGLLEDILNAVDHKRIIFEAPTPKTQMFFINLVGSDVNLGNVAISDLLLLETQRRALRYETFFLKH